MDASNTLNMKLLFDFKNKIHDCDDLPLYQFAFCDKEN